VLASPASSVDRDAGLSMSTDDAYVKATARLSLQGAWPDRRDSRARQQSVEAGQPLVRIDPKIISRLRAPPKPTLPSRSRARQQAASNRNWPRQTFMRRVRDPIGRGGAGTGGSRPQPLRRTRHPWRRLSARSGKNARTAASAEADADKSRAAYAASEQQHSVVAQSRGQLAAAVARPRPRFRSRA